MRHGRGTKDDIGGNGQRKVFQAMQAPRWDLHGITEDLDHRVAYGSNLNEAEFWVAETFSADSRMGCE